MRLDACLKWRRALELGAGFVSSIRGLRKAVIVFHRNADLDAFGAAVGVGEILSAYGVAWHVAAPEGLNKSVKELLNNINYNIKIISCNEIDENKYDLVVVVDSASVAQLGECRKLLETNKNIIVIDHHVKNNIIEKYSVKHYVFSSFSSSSEIVAAIAWGLNLNFSREVATLLYAGILSDSRGFKIIGEMTLEAASYLVSSGANVQLVVNQGKREPDTSERIAVLKALSRMIVGRACKDILITVSHVGSFESSAARAMLESGSDVAIVATDTREGVRVSIRVSNRAVENGITASSLAEFIAEKYGGEGGGHRNAGMVHIRSGVLTAQTVAEELGRILPGKVGRLCTIARRGKSREGSPIGGRGS